MHPLSYRIYVVAGLSACLYVSGCTSPQTTSTHTNPSTPYTKGDILGLGTASLKPDTSVCQAIKEPTAHFNCVMKTATPRMQAAYVRALDNDPTLEGDVTVGVTLSPAKSPQVVISDPNLQRSPLASSIKQIVQGLVFNPVTTTYRGQYTYRLTR